MAISSCTILRSAAISPSLNPFRLNRRLLRAHCSLRLRDGLESSSRVVKTLPSRASFVNCGFFLRTYSVISILSSVVEELKQLRSKKADCVSSKMGVLSNKEVEDKFEKRTMEKGPLLEFRKDSSRLLLAVAQKPDGKKNWMVCDQVLLKNEYSAAC